jgi:hypothetical protein
VSFAHSAMALRPGDHLLERLRRLEERVGHAAVAGLGRQQDPVLALGIVQRVVQPRHHPGGVAERLVLGDVLDALAVDVDLAAVGQRGEVVGAGLRRGDLHLAGGLGPGRERRAVILARGGFGGRLWRRLSQRLWLWRLWLWPSDFLPLHGFVRLSNSCTMRERG